MKRRVVATIALAGLTFAACGGPKEPFDIGTQAAPVDLVLGEHDPVIEAPVGPISAGLPRELFPFLPIGTKTPDAPLGPCPEVDPLAPVNAVGDGGLNGPAVNATYNYRAKTTDRVGKLESKFVGDSAWKITMTKPESGGHLLTMETTIAKVKTVRQFLIRFDPLLPLPDPGLPVVPKPNDPGLIDPNTNVIDQYNFVALLTGLPKLPRTLPNLANPTLPGVYLVSQTMGDSVFKPLVPIALFQTPLSPGRLITAVGTDGKTLMTFTSTIKNTDFVNACGTKVEALRIDLTGGRIAGLTDKGKVYRLKFTESLYFSLNAGGLPVRDVGTVMGDSDLLLGEKVARDFDFTINTEPKPSGKR